MAGDPGPVDTAAIAERLGVTVHAVRRWRQRDLGFPEPWVTLAVGPIWQWSDVHAWAKETGRLAKKASG